MHPTELGRHERQLAALAHDLEALGLHTEVEVHSGRRGRWLVTPGQGVRRIPTYRRTRQTGMHMVRVGLEVIHLTTDDLESVVLVAADLAVHGRSTLGSSSAGEYCLPPTLPILLRHPARPALWWFTGAGEVAELGSLQDEYHEAGGSARRRSGMMGTNGRRIVTVIGGSSRERRHEIGVTHE